MKRLISLLVAGCSLAVLAARAAENPACIPTMRPDKQHWAHARHAEIIRRLEREKDKHYELALVGDSITHRWENPANGLSIYPKLTSRYRTLNLGSGGDQTQHVLWRFEHGALGQDYPYTAKVFAVMIGVNNGSGDPQGIVLGVERIVREIRKAHPESKILILGILPHGKDPLKSPQITVVNPALERMADGQTVFYLDMGPKFLDAEGQIKPGLMMPDNLHPIAAGYELWLEAMCPVVDRLLGRAQFTDEARPVIRYGAKVTKAVRCETAAPKVVLPEGWRLVEGDDGKTGCDVRDYYFTVEASGKDLPPPKVELEWPGVAVKAVYGAKDVKIGDGRVTLVPTRRNGPPTSYITLVREGAIHLAWHHHVEGCQHGPYAGRPLPWTEIQASANWRAAAREAFKAAGLATFDRTDGASVNIYGFDSNFPNRHVDHPTHFHVMLEWNRFQDNNVGHYLLDPKGFIRGNDFLVCGKVPGYDRAGYYHQKLGETTDYNGPSGKTVFTLTMLSDGTGLVLRKPGCAEEWKIASAAPEKSAEAYAKDGDGWRLIASFRVEDDTVAGLQRIVRTTETGTSVEKLRYNPDTGEALKDLTAYEDTLRDHCWMWGHDSGYYDGTGPSSVYNIPLSDPITMADACAYMGIPNVCAVTWDAPSDAYLESFRKMKRVSWVLCGSVHGNHTIEDRFYRLLDRDFRLLDRLPNLIGLDLDDYFRYRDEPEVCRDASGRETKVAQSVIGHANLLDVRSRMDAYPRPLDLRVVLYIDQMKQDEQFVPALREVDTVMAWTWTGKNIARLRENFRRARAVAPGKRILMGVYMWDFGGRKPLEMEFMRSQLDIAHELYHSHMIDGFIFHCTPLVNKTPPIEAVEYARAWIAQHGDESRD